VVAGTPEFMAPEQARGEPIDHRADLFSLGSVLYTLCTGHPPFRGSTVEAVLLQVSDQAPRPIRELNPGVPVWLEQVIARLMAKGPADRYQSADEVAGLLEAYLAWLEGRDVSVTELPVLSITPTASPQPSETRRFVRTVFWTAWLLVLLLLGLGTGLWFAGAEDEPAPQDKSRQPAILGGLAEHLHFTFRSGLENHPLLNLFGPDVEELAKVDAQGLRFTLPVQRANHDVVGVESPIRLRGDFELTLEYELLDVPNPAPSRGAGVQLYITFDSRNDARASVTRSQKPAGPVFGANLITRGSDGKDQFSSLNVAAQDPRGKLRLTRIGNRLTFSVTDGEGQFRSIKTDDVGRDDVATVRAICMTGWEPYALDARLLELDLRAAQMPNKTALQEQPQTPAAVAPRSGGKGWLFLGLLFGLVLTVTLIVVLWKRATGQQPSSTGKPPMPTATGRDASSNNPRPAGAGKRSPRSPGLALLLLAFVGVATAWRFAGGAGEPVPQTQYAQEYYHSFKGDTGLPPGFVIAPPDADEFVSFGPEGLRITLPQGHAGPRPPIGIQTRFPVKGDFEITTTFKLLQEPTPEEAGKEQTRFTLTVGLDKVGFNVATISRRVEVLGGTQWLGWVSLGAGDFKDNRNRAKGFPTQATSGRLRLVRKGPLLSYHASEGADENFTPLLEYPFGPEDLNEVRLVGTTGSLKAALDVLVTDLRIRAESLPDLPATTPLQSRPRNWLAMVLLGLGFICGLITLGIWLALRQRDGARTPAGA
jgi:hypothetical protein